MRTILMSVLLLAVGMTAGAQELKVTVRSDTEPLAYAYVYINGKAAAVTDTLGIALIPDGKWSIGDTLSASYVGTTPDEVVLDRKSTKSGDCELLLSEMYTLTSDEVKVKADIEKLFRKTVKEVYGIIDGSWGEGQFEADATMRVEDSLGAMNEAAGRIMTHRNDVRPRNYASRDFRLTMKTQQPLGDMQSDLFQKINRMLSWTITPVFHFQERELQGAKRHLGYLGKREGCRVFRVTFPKIKLWWMTNEMLFIQIIAYVDEQTKLLRSVEAAYLSEGLELSVRLRADYTPYKLNLGWGKGRICMVPVSVNYLISQSDFMDEGTLKNGRFNPPKRTKGDGNVYVPYIPEIK